MEHIINVSDLKDGAQESVVVDDTPALVVRLGDNFKVIEDVCSHDGQPLMGGTVEDGVIACPRHGAKFDLENGDAKCMPATQGIRTFAVEVRGNEVWAGPQTQAAASAATATATTAAATSASGATAVNVPSPGSSEASVSSDPEESAEEKGDSTESDYLEALREVIDPELMINIVDLGLIYAVEQDTDSSDKLNVDMTLTSPACPAGPQLVQQSKMALERLHDVNEANITLVMSPPWTPERMTDEARDQLGIF